MKVYQLLNNRKKWTQQSFARDKKGQSVSPLAKSAVKWCVVGAITKCYNSLVKQMEIKLKLRSSLRYCSISKWNDHSTYENIIYKLKKLDI